MGTAEERPAVKKVVMLIVLVAIGFAIFKMVSSQGGGGTASA